GTGGGVAAAVPALKVLGYSRPSLRDEEPDTSSRTSNKSGLPWVAALGNPTRERGPSLAHASGSQANATPKVNGSRTAPPCRSAGRRSDASGQFAKPHAGVQRASGYDTLISSSSPARAAGEARPGG